MKITFTCFDLLEGQKNAAIHAPATANKGGKYSISIGVTGESEGDIVICITILPIIKDAIVIISMGSSNTLCLLLVKNVFKKLLGKFFRQNVRRQSLVVQHPRHNRVE